MKKSVRDICKEREYFNYVLGTGVVIQSLSASLKHPRSLDVYHRKFPAGQICWKGTFDMIMRQHLGRVDEVYGTITF